MKNFNLIFIVTLLLFSCKKEESKISHTSNEISQDTIEKKKISQDVDSSQIRQQEEEEKEWKLHEKEIERIEEGKKNNFIYHKNSNGYLLKLFCSEEHSGIVNFKKVEILKNSRLIQKIKVDSAYVYEKNQIEIGINNDANFDGYKDLQLINWIGMHDGTYHFWIYNPKTKKFLFNKSLSKIMNPGFDKSKKEITSGYHIGPVPNSEDVYIWENDKAVLDHGYQCCSPENGKYLKFYRKNGKMIYNEVEKL